MNKNIINQFILYIDKERNFSENTMRCYKNDLIQFNEFLSRYDNSLSFLDIDKTAIQFYIQDCSKNGMTDKTLLRKVSTIKSLFKYLTQNSQIDYNISKLIPSPKVAKKIPHYLSKKQIEELMSLPDLSTKRGLMHKSILETFYSSGLRISELAEIKVKNLDLNKRILKILGKGNKERIVIIGEVASTSIKNYLRVSKNSDNIYLYPSSNKMNSHMSVSYIYKMVKQYLIKVTNDEKMSPHSLRHSFATHLLDNGADLMSVKELLGHEDLSSTQVYTHISVDKMKKIYKQSHPHGK